MVHCMSTHPSSILHPSLDNNFLLLTGFSMAPVPLRGKVAQPGMVALVARKLAELRGEPLEAIIEATRQNTRDMYGI